MIGLIKKLLPILVIVLIAFNPSVSYAESTNASTCVYSLFKLNVAFEGVSEFDINTSLSYKEISEQMNDSDQLSVGFTDTQYTVETYKEKLCTYTLVVKSTKKVVYLAKEFLGNQCVVNQILSHELKHVKLTYLYEAEFESKLNKAVTTAISELNSPSEVDILNTIKTKIIESQDEFTAAQKGIDTHEEYVKAALDCNGFLNKFFKLDN